MTCESDSLTVPILTSINTLTYRTRRSQLSPRSRVGHPGCTSTRDRMVDCLAICHMQAPVFQSHTRHTMATLTHRAFEGLVLDSCVVPAMVLDSCVVHAMTTIRVSSCSAWKEVLRRTSRTTPHRCSPTVQRTPEQWEGKVLLVVINLLRWSLNTKWLYLPHTHKNCLQGYHKVDTRLTRSGYVMSPRLTKQIQTARSRYEANMHVSIRFVTRFTHARVFVSGS